MVQLITTPHIKIVTTDEELRLAMLRIEEMGRICYQSGLPEDVNSASQFVRMLIKRGHLSVLEHGSLSVKFLNCSRGMTHELVRHRLADYSQESTRFVDYKKHSDIPGKADIEVIEPPLVTGKSFGLTETLTSLGLPSQLTMYEMYLVVEQFYQSLRDSGIKAEDARSILPTGLKSEIGMTASFTEWRHVFKLRLSKAAHWEIRSHMCLVIEFLQNSIVAPIFEDFVVEGQCASGVDYYSIIK